MDLVIVSQTGSIFPWATSSFSHQV